MVIALSTGAAKSAKRPNSPAALRCDSFEKIQSAMTSTIPFSNRVVARRYVGHILIQSNNDSGTTQGQYPRTREEPQSDS